MINYDKKFEMCKRVAHRLVEFGSFKTYNEAFERITADAKKKWSDGFFESFEENEDRLVDCSLNHETGNYNIMWTKK